MNGLDFSGPFSFKLTSIMENANYSEIAISVTNQEVKEILIAQLADIGYEAFEESETDLKAFILETDFNEETLVTILKDHDLSFSRSIIKKQNWNSLWESNFEPVQVADFVGIRAGFHPSFTNVTHEIVITPKMSFGTGHHATTYLVMQLMRDINFKEASVFDFGSGTGILAILAEKLGAKKILAVDNDDWCIENALENVAINKCEHIMVNKVDELHLDQKFNTILANINRNILIDNIQNLRNALEINGNLVLSGLLKENESEMVSICVGLGLFHRKTVERNGWIALYFFNTQIDILS